MDNFLKVFKKLISTFCMRSNRFQKFWTLIGVIFTSVMKLWLVSVKFHFSVPGSDLWLIYCRVVYTEIVQHFASSMRPHRRKVAYSHINNKVWLYRSPSHWVRRGYFTCPDDFYLPSRCLEEGGGGVGSALYGHWSNISPDAGKIRKDIHIIGDRRYNFQCHR